MRRVDKRTYNPECKRMHLLVEMIARGRKYFAAKTHRPRTLIMHIPLPVQEALVASLGGFGVKTIYGTVHILDIKCVPAYENRIVISHPAYAIYENEPMVIIEFENGNNYPTYKEIN